MRRNAPLAVLATDSTDPYTRPLNPAALRPLYHALLFLMAAHGCPGSYRCSYCRKAAEALDQAKTITAPVA